MAVVYHEESMLTDLSDLCSRTYRVRLFKNNFTPDQANVEADFTEADFSGYVEHVPAWPTPAINGDGNAQADSDEAHFVHNGGATANNIYGWYMVDLGAGEVVFSERFEGAPVVMAAPPDEIRVTVRRIQGSC